MNPPPISKRHHERPTVEPSWATISVRNFFERIPWTGVSVSVSDVPSGRAASDTVEASSLSLKLSVGEYFDQFPWDGQPHIAVAVTPISIKSDSSPAEDVTLEGFADFF